MTLKPEAIISQIKLLGVPELQNLREIINTELASRAEDAPAKIFLNTEKYFDKNPNRAGGGWTKNVIRLDKSQNNGYSIIGNFKKNNVEDVYIANRLYLDCENIGSYNYPTRNRIYNLFTVTSDSKNPVNILAQGNEKDWLRVIWQAAEEFWSGH